jgi:ubiquinone/menaquinone biosynthesis C-methylase UbiE
MGFEGLANFLDYLRNLRLGGLVLDVGAGTTRAVAQLSDSYLGRDLTFGATILTRMKEISENLGFERTIETEVEKLRGVNDKSVTGVISFSALAYSAAPQLAVRSIDRVLIPGGAVKANFKFPPSSEEHSARRFSKTHDEFSDTFLKLGYDIALGEAFQFVTMVAIKPGGQKSISAKELLNSDVGAKDYLVAVRELFPSVRNPAE